MAPRHRQNLSEDPSTEPSLQLLTYDVLLPPRPLSQATAASGPARQPLRHRVTSPAARHRPRVLTAARLLLWVRCAQQVRQHNTQDDCWIVVNGKAYDVTDFMPDHPGGASNATLRPSPT